MTAAGVVVLVHVCGLEPFVWAVADSGLLPHNCPLSTAHCPFQLPTREEKTAFEPTPRTGIPRRRGGMWI